MADQAAPPAPAPAQEIPQSPANEWEDPCYDRIPDLRAHCADEVGSAFSFVLVGSSAINLVRGLCGGGGLAGAARAVSANAPRAAGSVAAYFGLYTASQGALSLARRKEDHWNGFAAAAASWAALGARRGAAGAALLGFMKGLEIMQGPIVDFLWDYERTPPRTRRILPLPAAAAPAGGDEDFLGMSRKPQVPPGLIEKVPAANLGF